MSARILPDPAQIAAADPGQSVFVTANAGSGKTSTLVDRVARLLLREVRPGEILCVTYTKAAAAEMQARLFDRLGEWAVLDDDRLRVSLADLDGRDPASLSGPELSDARRLFAKALETPGGLKIQTIHAFCEKLLRRFPIEAGVTPGFTVLEDQAAVALSHSAREELARAALRDADGPIGQAYSHFAVELDWGAFQSLLAMIEADRDKLADYVDRVGEGRAPGPHLLVGAHPEQTAEAVEGDFMRFLDRAEWLETASAMATGGTNDQKCADRMRAADWTFAGIADVFLTGGEPRKVMATSKAPPTAVGWLVDLQMKYVSTLEQVRRLRVARDTIHVLTLAAAHARLYEQAKAATGALDFGDLVARTVELLTRRASAAWVLYKLDGGIEHVLVDEAQDTAPQQWDILKALTESFFAGEGGRRFTPPPASGQRLDRTVFAVGDEKQSIYSFQGARPERLRQESQRYDMMVQGAGAEFRAVELAKSFRSTPDVLGFVDAVFAGPERAAALVGESLAAVPAHTAMRADQAGSVDLWPLHQEIKGPDREAWDAPVDQEAALSARKQLAADLANDIRLQVEAGVTVYDRKTREPRPSAYGDFLILVRRRDATFEEIIRALKTAGVPVAGADRLKLSSHIVFDDLIALARFVLYPDDDLSLAGLLRSPLSDVDEDGLFALAGAKPERGRLWRELTDRAGERREWSRARDMLQFALSVGDRDPFSFFSAVLGRVDDTGVSGRARILRRLGAEAEEAIDETLNQVLAAEGRGAIDLETCLARLEAADVEVKRELEGPRGEVRVMTVHGAKGLEAPVVILPDTTSRAKAQGPSLMSVTLEDGSEAWLMCPGSSKEDCEASRAARDARQARADAETLRLLYVALTRARDRIVIMGKGSARTKAGFDEGSWWDVLTRTFDGLEGKVRTVGALRRYGADPGRLPPQDAAPVGRVIAPDWTRISLSPDPAARIASPSKMDEVLRIPSPSPLATGSGGLGRFRRGDLIHRLLERLPDVPLEDRPAIAEHLLSRERDLSEDQRAEMIESALTVLAHPLFAPVFGAGSRPEVALTGQVDGVTVSGRMDRLVVTPEGVLVVDYKTNRPAPSRIENADPAYVLQLAVYVSILRQMYPDRPVEAALVWTDGPQLMPVPQAMLEAALIR